MKKFVCIMTLIGLTALSGTGSIFADNDDDDGPTAGLTKRNANAIFAACKTAAQNTPSPLRGTSFTKMWCAVVDREGHLLLIRATDTGEEPGSVLNSDAWRGSIEIAIAKAYTGVAFSSNDLALDSAQIGTLSQPGQALFGIGNTNPYRPLTGSRSLSPDDRRSQKHHGIVTFGGGEPVYNCATGDLLGAVGVSGDGVPQDVIVAEGAVTGAGFCLTP